VTSKLDYLEVDKIDNKSTKSKYSINPPLIKWSKVKVKET
jgi:hypothetical protein